VNEGRFRTELAGGFQHVERAEGIDLEIEERNSRGTVVRRLGSGVDDQIRTFFFHDTKHRFAIADVNSFMLVAGNFASQTF
jgi:hypothetical protein